MRFVLIVGLLSKAQSVSEGREANDRAVEREMIDVVLRFVLAMGLPRSVGEIYGFLFVQDGPTSMEAIRKELSISMGSASQGLKQLRAMKAVKVVYIAGDRRDFYVAETELRQFLGGFLRETILPQLEETETRLEALEPKLKKTGKKAEHYRSRWQKMRQWQTRARRWIGPIVKIVGS